MKDPDVLDLLDNIDATADAIDDVVMLMLGEGDTPSPGALVLSKLHKNLRSELTELSHKCGYNQAG